MVKEKYAPLLAQVWDIGEQLKVIMAKLQNVEREIKELE